MGTKASNDSSRVVHTTKPHPWLWPGRTHGCESLCFIRAGMSFAAAGYPLSAPRDAEAEAAWIIDGANVECSVRLGVIPCPRSRKRGGGLGGKARSLKYAERWCG